MLLEEAPARGSLPRLSEFITGLPEVQPVLVVHLWSIDSEITTMSVMVVMEVYVRCHWLRREID
jgi:Co/Zn/Cd efflux system component